jgi:GT2 family glycosyltransferase
MTAMLIRRECFLGLEGLDERFGSYLEDVDFGLACASKGYIGRYVPEAVAYHVGSGTRGPWHPETVRQISRNQVLLVVKWQGSRGWIRNGWRIAVGQGLWGLLAAKHGRAAAWFRGKMDGIRLARSFPAEGDRKVSDWLDRAEAEIARLQELAGWQPYWRWYFRLVGTPGSK